MLDPIKIQPTLLIIMLTGITFIVLNERNHLIVFQQPLLIFPPFTLTSPILYPYSLSKPGASLEYG